MWSLAHVYKRPAGIKTEGIVCFEEFFGIFNFQLLTHSRKLLDSLFFGKVFPLEFLLFLNNLPHSLFQVGKIGFCQGFLEKKIIIKTRADRRAETQLGFGPNLQNGFRQDMGHGMAKLI